MATIPVCGNEMVTQPTVFHGGYLILKKTRFGLPYLGENAYPLLFFFCFEEISTKVLYTSHQQKVTEVCIGFV